MHNDGVFERVKYPIVTPRLLLRPLSELDASSLTAYRSLADVCRYVPFVPMTENDVTTRIQGIWSRIDITNEGDGVTLGVELRDTSSLVGDLMLRYSSEVHRSGEIGWVFHPDFSGQGYATEAAHALLHCAFHNFKLHRVTARIDARNNASIRLAERLSMRREAYFVANEWFKGEWTDEVNFALLETEWDEDHSKDLSTCSWQPRLDV